MHRLRMHRSEDDQASASKRHRTDMDTTPLDTTPLHTTPLDTTPLHTMPLHTMPLDTTPLDTQLPTTLELTEHPNVANLEWVVGHDHVRHQDRPRLADYAQAVRSGGGQLTVTYTRRGPGRLYPDSPVQVATNQRRQVRATLFADTHLDVDLVNCHPRLLYALVQDCSKIGSHKCTHLKE